MDDIYVRIYIIHEMNNYRFSHSCTYVVQQEAGTCNIKLICSTHCLVCVLEKHVVEGAL